MKQTFKTLTAAFALSSALSNQTLAQGSHHSGITPDECTDLMTSGEASWYGDEVAVGRDKHGKLIFNDTASGEPFNPDLLTAAYPVDGYMGEYFLVATRSREVIVRINDIGPSRTNPDTKDRVIDLSEAAARRLGMKGVANVRVYRCS